MQFLNQSDLREACQDLHKTAEQTKLAQDLVNGTIDPAVYKQYLWQMYLITDTIETQVYLPDDLLRRFSFVQDIAECQPGPVATCQATNTYLLHLASKFKPNLTGQFKGHIYAHYLGMLYGGQMIAKRLDLPKNHLRFNEVKPLVDHVRQEILVDITAADIYEARKAFEAIIDIYKELCFELH